ncbi:ABA4-like family protein [Nodosilinea sp. E11]|uniref:ABA4-like family protein n=1 Tax=Nodosilinea sp. E11 TaxID=3037479 RepID=UPI0029345F0B|nr:ABA4-like family protein [Nodosilinea sp. E11]WOD39502.1 ABA4-like family protein [Nodosilinea sp. E11]
MTVDANLLELLFSGANLFVLPFWTLMVLVPNTKLTRTVMGSLLPFAALAGLYLFLFVTSFGNVDGIEALSDPNLSLGDLAAIFAQPHVTATGWVHFLAFDLFVGRWIYWQGQERGVFTRHSLALCLFAGPLGLLSHLVTDALWQRFAKGRVEEVVG